MIFNEVSKVSERFNGSGLPDIAVGKEGNCYIRTLNQTIFKKFIPRLSTVIFDKNTKHKTITLSDNYKCCSGPTSNLPFGGFGIKSLPLIEYNKLVFSIRIKSMSRERPIIGFCDESTDLRNNKLTNFIGIKLGEANIHYIRNNKTECFRDAVHRFRSVRIGDVVQIAIDIDSNKIWFGMNADWFNGRPNIIEENSSDFLPSFLSDITPVLFVVPCGCELEIIDYQYQLPSQYKQAISIPCLDWYKSNEYNQEGLL